MLDDRARFTALRGKPEAVVITKKRVRNEIKVRCAGFTVESNPSVKYLGVQVDKKLIFTKHVELAADRAAATVRQLGYFMPKISTPPVLRNYVETPLRSPVLGQYDERGRLEEVVCRPQTLPVESGQLLQDGIIRWR